MSRIQPGLPGESIAGMAAGRYDRNEGRAGIESFPRHAFQGAKRQRRDNGANGLAPCGMAGYFPRCLVRDANTMGFMASRATAKPENQTAGKTGRITSLPRLVLAGE